MKWNPLAITSGSLFSSSRLGFQHVNLNAKSIADVLGMSPFSGFFWTPQLQRLKMTVHPPSVLSMFIWGALYRKASFRKMKSHWCISRSRCPSGICHLGTERVRSSGGHSGWLLKYANFLQPSQPPTINDFVKKTPKTSGFEIFN